MLAQWDPHRGVLLGLRIGSSTAGSHPGPFSPGRAGKSRPGGGWKGWICPAERVQGWALLRLSPARGAAPALPLPCFGTGRPLLFCASVSPSARLDSSPRGEPTMGCATHSPPPLTRPLPSRADPSPGGRRPAPLPTQPGVRKPPHGARAAFPGKLDTQPAPLPSAGFLPPSLRAPPQPGRSARRADGRSHGAQPALRRLPGL